MSNMPKVKIEIVAVSRDCFPESTFRKQKGKFSKCIYTKVWKRRHLRMSNLYC